MRQIILPVIFASICVFFYLFSPAIAGDWPDSCGKNKSHNALFGRRSPYDRLLYVNHTAKPKSFGRKLSFDVTIPPKAVFPKGVISYVEVLDQYRDGNGGCAFLKSGGVGYTNVTLHFKSQRGEGVNFVTNVYGRSF